MNQFKRAKQISNQSERITDLKTAGVAVPSEKIPAQDQETAVTLNMEDTNIPQSVIPEGENTVVPKTEVPSVSAGTVTDAAAHVPTIKTMSEDTSLEKLETAPQPVIYNEPAPVQHLNTQPQISPQQAVQQTAQPQHPEVNTAYAAESVETKPVKNSKKSPPNMFIQKNESKSIRKSLVLRPSSVKIAENYCAKNGGSFNELIQILLDNFIEEYGL